MQEDEPHFLALILKVNAPQFVKDFRFISICNVIYIS